MDREQDIGQRIGILRKRSGLSIRLLAERAGVTGGIISCIERGKNSPSIATLQKILSALGTDLRTFFGGGQHVQEGPVIPREHMRFVSDKERSYTIVFPKRKDIKVEMLDEQIQPSKRRPAFEKLPCDVAGYVLAGSIVLEIEKQPARTLRPGDAFYVPKGSKHRGYAVKDEPARLITVYYPGKY